MLERFSIESLEPKPMKVISRKKNAINQELIKTQTKTDQAA